jgi:uncharacterized protein YegL
MTTINMLSWWQWALLAAVPPAIVLLYFLKLRRTSQRVPSTYLWRRTIEDYHVNSLWQRLRSSLLLLLQILLVALVMLAVLRPGFSGGELIGNRFIFLIDTSASMSATDVGTSRLAEAQRRAGELIEQMDSGDQAMIISFSDVARVEQSFTDNRRELQRRLSLIRPTNRATVLGEALSVAAGLAGSLRANRTDNSANDEPATVYILSDGRFHDVTETTLTNLTFVFVPIGSPSAVNVAITAFGSQSRETQDTTQVFARLENFSAQAVSVDVELHRDNLLLDSKVVALEPQRSGGVVFEPGDLRAGAMELRIRPGGALALDDRAWTAIDPPRPANVLVVTPGNDALALALDTDRARKLADVEIAQPEFLDSKDYQDKAAGGHYRLVIYDQCQPKQMPQANTLFIGRLPPLESWSGEGRLLAPQIVDVDTAHPLMHLVELGNVKFAEVLAMKPPGGSTALVSSDNGPLLAIAPRDSFEDAVLAGEIVGRSEAGQQYANSDWPLRLSFPVFFLNAIAYFGGAESASPNVRPGQAVTLRAAGPAESLTVEAPSGASSVIRRGSGEPFRFTATEEVGVYTVSEEGQPPRHFAVNLFDSAESDIRPGTDIRIGHETVHGQASWAGAPSELWKPLLGLALVVLLAEWYIWVSRQSSR